jgi:hypothetical protein
LEEIRRQNTALGALRGKEPPVVCEGREESSGGLDQRVLAGCHQSADAKSFRSGALRVGPALLDAGVESKRYGRRNGSNRQNR